MKKIAYYIVVGFLFLISLLPMRVLYIISDGLYYILYYVVKYRKQVVETNLRNSFPEKSPDEIRQISKRFYRHISDIFVETVAYITISRKSINKRVVYRNTELIDRYYNEGRQVIGIMAHYCNWEWGGNFAMHTSYKPLITYKPLEDKNFDGLFKRMRQRFGFTLLSMQETTRKMIEYIRNGEKVMMVLITDQTPGIVSIHYYIDFLGQDTAVFTGSEKMAQAFDAPMVYIKIEKVKRGYYEVEFVPITDKPKEFAPLELTKLQFKLLEEQIREKPEYWLWSHRRWKYKREDLHPTQVLNN